MGDLGHLHFCLILTKYSETDAVAYGGPRRFLHMGDLGHLHFCLILTKYSETDARPRSPICKNLLGPPYAKTSWVPHMQPRRFQSLRGERREARGERREARGERREARGERREVRGERREASPRSPICKTHVGFRVFVSKSVKFRLSVPGTPIWYPGPPYATASVSESER